MATKRAKAADTNALATNEPGDPTTDEALRALGVEFASSPDMPVAVAVDELSSLARLAKTRGEALAKIGLSAATLDTLSRFSSRLKALEAAWQKARDTVKFNAAERRLVAEAEALDAKLLAGGRWACRDSASDQQELSRIAEGADLADTIQDLRDLAAFWADRAAELAHTDITPRDLARAIALADKLDLAAQKEARDVAAATTHDLRNRCFWAANALATTVREGGRYALRAEPKLAAKFVSRHRTSRVRASRRRAKTPPAPPQE